jgi:hypothetical protein
MDKERRIRIRQDAIAMHELIKGFTTQTSDNAMKTAIKFADYILEETQDVAEDALQRSLNGM